VLFLVLFATRLHEEGIGSHATPGFSVGLGTRHFPSWCAYCLMLNSVIASLVLLLGLLLLMQLAGLLVQLVLLQLVLLKLLKLVLLMELVQLVLLMLCKRRLKQNAQPIMLTIFLPSDTGYFRVR
jgi:hypothetical protein